MKFPTLPHQKKRERSKNMFFQNISKTPEKFSLVTLGANYHKLSLLPLVVRH